MVTLAFSQQIKTLVSAVIVSSIFLGCAAAPSKNASISSSAQTTAARSRDVLVKATTKEELLNAANVDHVEAIENQSRDARVFSVSGGDPAMNGAYVNLAVFLSVDRGWTVFELANVHGYEVIKSTTDGVVAIHITRDTFDSNEEIIQVSSTLELDIEKSEQGSIAMTEVPDHKTPDSESTKTIVLASTDEMLLAAASVDTVIQIESSNLSAKIFSVSGGDPAMNGAYLNVAVYVDVSTGWNVYELADVRDFEMMKSARDGYAKIKLTRDSIDRNGDIQSSKSMLFLNLLNGENGSILTNEVR